jgi:hypothetical protein
MSIGRCRCCMTKGMYGHLGQGVFVKFRDKE